jgi:hypothetical protein
MPAAASSISGGNVARKTPLSVMGKGTLRLVEEELISVAQFSALTNLYDGQEARILVDATAGIIWTVKYRPASAHANKWEVIDASEIHAAVETSEGVGAGGLTMGNLATVGPSVAVPLAGEYDVEWGSYMATGWDGSNVSSGPCWVSLSGAGFTAATSVSVSVGGTMASSTIQAASPSRKIRKALTVATITAKYQAGNSSGAGSTFAQRFLSIRPIRISQ